MIAPMTTWLSSITPPALKHRNFTLLWLGLLISVAGSQMQVAALLWHLRVLTDQPVVISGIGLMRFVPVLLFAPFGGVIADAFNRKKILFITQLVQMLVALGLGLLTWLNIIQIWHIYVLTAVQAAAVAFDLPARQSLTPNLVPRDILPSAFSLQSISFSVGNILGPGLSGFAIAAVGLHSVYLFNAASFLAVLVALVLMSPVPQETHSAALGARASLRSIREGVQFILGQPIILSSMLLDFVATFFSSATTLLPFVVKDILKAGAIQFGWLISAESIGAVVVGMVFAQVRQIRRQGSLLLLSVSGFGLATVLFGLSRTFWMAMVALILVGAGDSISTILRNTIRQIQTPDYIRGRMVSINQIFFMGGPQLGEIEAGLAAQAWGVPFAIISGGVGCIIGVLLVAGFYRPLRSYNGDEPLKA
jgi:MFS family permease